MSKLRTPIAAALALAMVSVACRSDPAPAARVDPTQPETCEGCHATVVQEWRDSMHAHAHPSKDPIFGGMRAMRIAREGASLAGECGQCHHPSSPAAPDTPAAEVGVACAACHAIQAVDRSQGKYGARALVPATDGAFRGPHDLAQPASPAHGTGLAPDFMKDGETLCLACHDVVSNPKGVASCTTGDEYRARSSSAATCTSCHMARVPGPSGGVSQRSDHASHRFAGPHRAWATGQPDILGEAVELAAAFEGEALVVTLRNVSSHGFPSGFPARLAVVRVEGFDASGAPVWRNFEADPMKESPESVLGKVYVDESGQPTVAAFASALKRDSRLATDEVRALRYAPPATVLRAEVKLLFRLGPTKFFEMLGLQDRPEAEARVIETASATRSAGASGTPAPGASGR